MKIGVILDTEFTTDIRVMNEVQFLVAAGYELHVLCPAFEEQLLVEPSGNATIHRFRLNKALKNILFGMMNTLPFYELLWILKVRKFISQCQPDVLHAHDLFMSRIASRGGKGKLPVVLDLHENFPAAIKAFRWSTRFPHVLLSRPDRWQKKEGKYLSYASRLVVLSESFKNTLLNKYNFLRKEDLFVYPNVPDLSRLLNFPIDQQVFPANDRFILFYFGGIGERRGIFTCFEAIRMLKKDIPEIHLLLIGPVDRHEQAQFNSFLHDTEISNHITHYEWKDLSLLPSYVLASNICLSPLLRDEQHDSGVANKIFQYMLFERPILVSDCIPQLEIVETEQCGEVFRNGDAKDLAEKIRLLYNHPDRCKLMGKNGRQAVLERFNLDKCGEQLDLLYRSMGSH